MTKRLQVLLEDEELSEIKRAAKGRRQSVAEWVRAALRQARAAEAGRPAAEKLRVLDASVGHDFPTGPIDQMLSEIEQGYRGAP
ncbi:MAG: antitoxin [Candidatus Limnocylindria bacterium]